MTNPRTIPDLMAERAALAHLVIGADRAEKIISRCADGLSLRYGMRPDGARRYAESLYEAADTWTLLGVEQTWARKPGQMGPGDVLADITGPLGNEQWTVEGFTDDGMVAIGNGTYVAFSEFDDRLLVAWPDEYSLDDEAPRPPAAPLPATVEPQDDDASDSEEEPYDPRAVWFIVHRVDDEGFPAIDGLPLLASPYRAMNWKKPGYEPYYGNALDVVAYLAEHLSDYRLGWPDYRDQWSSDSHAFFGAFNELDGGCECDVRVAGYLGWWLWQRVRADAVAEHGGTGDDYNVSHMWSPGKADVILAAAPYADPDWEIPPDHPLAQCDGQTTLELRDWVGEAA